jgi:8-oxo-dGTP pyrophosphatase MutT (NUDIX family)
MFTYCPACASKKIRFDHGKVFRCPDCGFTYYHNTAAATACIVRAKAGLLFLVRARDPGKGLLDLPGGFVDPGEGAIDGLRREFIEELGFDPLESKGGEVSPLAPTASGVFRHPPLLDVPSLAHPKTEFASQTPDNSLSAAIPGGGNHFTLFASFPNVYPYKNIVYNTCDLFFCIDIPNLCEDDLRLEASEVSSVRFIQPKELNLEIIAFESAKLAVKRYVELFC